MAIFAKVENGVVVSIQVFSDSVEEQNATVSGFGGTWLKSSDVLAGNVVGAASVPCCKNHASIGDTYDADRNAFISPQPFPSWLLNEATCQWGAPIPMPEEGGPYMWSEQSWIDDQIGWVTI